MIDDRIKALKLKSLCAVVVEESPSMRNLIVGFLQSFDVGRILTPADPSDAMAVLASTKADFVFCNWTRSPIDSAAFTLCVRASADETVRRTPIVILKAAARQDAVFAARDAGVTEFLAIPISGNTLLRAIETVLTRKRQFIDAEAFRGPDRRRRAAGSGHARRESDGGR